LANSSQENATFPWLSDETAKKMLNLLGSLENPPRNIESLATK